MKGKFFSFNLVDPGRNLKYAILEVDVIVEKERKEISVVKTTGKLYLLKVEVSLILT